MKGEIRQDITTGDWVILAPGRVKRPSDFNRKTPSPPAEPDYDPDCPFCPGNEELIPPILVETAADDGGGWQTRVIPNKYPILSPEGGGRGRSEGLFPQRPNRGRHEIVIESPRHNLDLEEMGLPELARVLQTWRDCCRTIRAEAPQLTPVIFRNRGPRAGTSLVHPHSQLVATAVLPPRMARRERVARKYFRDRSSCPYCDLLAAEEAEGKRILSAGEGLTAFIPFAASVPFETWIIPRNHLPDFAGIGSAEIIELAGTLRDILLRLKSVLDDFSYNCMLSPPFSSPDSKPFSHWHLRILPRLTTPAGFEFETGMAVNPGRPEEEAARINNGM